MISSSTPLPLPPVELAVRVGELTATDPMGRYEAIGAALKQVITDCLPADWTWPGRRALDFGAGAGRVIRHFATEAAAAEFWGCDIDGPSIAWMDRHLCPPFHAFTVDERPGLPQADEFFDVAWAMSVFTHLDAHWAGWLLELHRVLKPRGYLIATYMGADMSRELLGEPWDESRIGMNVVGAGRPWSEGGPWVFHSDWWLRSHWGRAFEIIRLDRNDGSPGTHGLIVLRKRPVSLSAGDLTRPEAGEPRELAALEQNLGQLHAEDRRVRRRVAQLEARLSRRLSARVWRLIRPTKLGLALQDVRRRARTRSR